MNTFKTLSLALATVLSVTAHAQKTAITGTTTGAGKSKNIQYEKPVWSIGLSGVVVDDDGQPFGDLFNVADSWNFLPFPTRVHVDMAINPSWSFEGAVSYSTFKTGNIINDDSLTADAMFLAVDVNARFHFIKTAKVFDPYGTAGLGFTYRSNYETQTPTLNAGLGANIWFIPSLALNLQTTAKVKMISGSSSYMMHSVGVVYRFGK